MAPFATYLLALALGLSAASHLPAQPAVPPVPAAVPDALTARQADHVAALGQVWGLLKYHHPAVAAGQRDWDAEFRRQLPRVLACRSVAARSRLLSAWVASLGPVPPCATCAAPPTGEVRLAPNLRWAENKHRFSAELRRQLADIQANRYQGTPYYVGQLGSSTLFLHEEAYADQPCPPADLRLLGLCRYWNMYQYYYPYSYVWQEDWAHVLRDVLPRFAAANTALRYRHAAAALFTRVHDGHARYYPLDPLLEAERGDYLVAADVQFIDNQAVVTHVRQDGLVPASPLAVGDVIQQVAGTPVAKLVQQRLPETPGSNRPAQLNTIAGNLLYATTPQLALQVERAGQPLSLAVPAERVGTVPAEKPTAADSTYRFLTPDVGYLDMARLSRQQVPVAMRAFAHTKGIVVDQRNYPAPILYELAPYFALPRPVPFASSTERDKSYPGRFLWQPADSVQARGPAAYPGRVVVLVNEKSRSMAEFTAMALRATPNCLLLGSQTAGADGNASKIVLPGGLNTLMTGIGIHYPDRGETQQVGLRLDVTLRPTVAGIRAGRDELRDRAVELIQRPVTNAN
jgi:C-terminal processing protease CtpA/Prc